MEDMITMYQERATNAMGRFLRTLSFVPADKLTWSPTPTAKSALQIAAHCAGYSGHFAAIIRAGAFPWSGQEFMGRVQSSIDGITTLEQAEAVLRRGIADSVAALGAVKPEQIDSIVAAPGLGPTPFTFFMILPAYHLDNHTGQIDYLQTCWGDQEVHL
jgi:hypothetical protein